MHFPDKPKVRDDTKAFIRRCLAYYQHERPSVEELSRDPYLQGKW